MASKFHNLGIAQLLRDALGIKDQKESPSVLNTDEVIPVIDLLAMYRAAGLPTPALAAGTEFLHYSSTTIDMNPAEGPITSVTMMPFVSPQDHTVPISTDKMTRILAFGFLLHWTASTTRTISLKGGLYEAGTDTFLVPVYTHDNFLNTGIGAMDYNFSLHSATAGRTGSEPISNHSWKGLVPPGYTFDMVMNLSGGLGALSTLNYWAIAAKGGNPVPPI